MQVVDIYVGTNLRGPARGIGKVMYVMRSKLSSGKDHESKPAVMESEENATEGRMVLYAVRDALARLNFSCEVHLHTECNHVAAAINNGWLKKWEENGWKNQKGEDVKDSALWSEVLNELSENGHVLTAEPGKHEFTGWMKWNLELAKAYVGVFTEVKEVPNPVPIR